MNTFLLYLKFLPAVLEAIQAIEVAVPLPVAGVAKLNLITGLVGEAYATEQDVVADLGKGFTIAKVAGIVTKVVNFVVSVFNTLKLFKTSKPVVV